MTLFQWDLETFTTVSSSKYLVFLYDYEPKSINISGPFLQFLLHELLKCFPHISIHPLVNLILYLCTLCRQMGCKGVNINDGWIFNFVANCISELE